MARLDSIRRWRAIGAGICVGLALGGCQSDLLGGPTTASTGPSTDTIEYVTQFKKVDTAGTGKITLDQATAHYTQVFAQLDINHDGFLTANELQPMVPLMRAKTGDELLAMLDRNGDGKLSQKEFLVISNWLFQRAKRAEEMTLADAKSGSARAIDKDTGKKEAPDQGKSKGPGPR